MTQAPLFIFDSIGSRFWLEPLNGRAFNKALQREVLQYCSQFDELYSRFKSTSLVSALARYGVLLDPPPEMLKMLEWCKHMYDVSGGAFNITVGATLHALGYGEQRHAGRVIQDPWEQITWTKHEVRSPKGMMLDFGGMGKGWMIDAITDIVRKHDVKEFIVNGGGDMYVQSDTPIEITLEDPLQPGTALRTVWLQNASLACSDTVKRAWQSQKGKKHHIIDPQQEDSSHTGVTASYVIADTALLADSMATIVILRPALVAALKTEFRLKVLLLP